MKALTLWEPWASLVVIGAKKFETRPRAIKYRGPLAIHAAKNEEHLELCVDEPFYSAMVGANLMTYALGHVIGIVDLVDCQRIVGTMKISGDVVMAALENGVRVTGDELAFGHYESGRFVYVLDNPRRIEPVPARGMQGLWNWEGGEGL